MSRLPELYVTNEPKGEKEKTVRNTGITRKNSVCVCCVPEAEAGSRYTHIYSLTLGCVGVFVLSGHTVLVPPFVLHFINTSFGGNSVPVLCFLSLPVPYRQN